MYTQLCERLLSQEMYNMLENKVNTDFIDMLNVFKNKNIVELSEEDCQEIKTLHTMTLLSNFLEHKYKHTLYLEEKLVSGYEFDLETWQEEINNYKNLLHDFLLERHNVDYFLELYERFLQSRAEANNKQTTNNKQTCRHQVC